MPDWLKDIWAVARELIGDEQAWLRIAILILVLHLFTHHLEG